MIEKLQAPERKVSYILGARLRNVKEIKETVLSRAGRYHEVQGPREKSKDPSPLKVKNVKVGERRYVVCFNAEQARKDQADNNFYSVIQNSFQQRSVATVETLNKFITPTFFCSYIFIEKTNCSSTEYM